MTSDFSIRSAHVVVDLGGERHPVSFATDIARRAEAHLTGVSFAFQPIIPVYTMAAPVPTDFIVAAHEHAIADAKSAASRFEEMALAAGITYTARSVESVPGDGFAAAIRNFQLSDLVVVGQQDPDRLEPMREGLIEALLFQAGASIFLVPHSGVTTFRPDRVVVGWDMSPTAARAVRAALPLLRMAARVDVVTIAEPKKQVDAPGTEIGRYLARHGLKVETHQIEPGGAETGLALMRFAVEKEADWVLMGAYGHSRVREFFLGGATRSILSSATLPVFMAH